MRLGFILVIAGIMILVLFFLSFSSTQVKEIHIQGIEEVTQEHFILQGAALVANPGPFPVPVSRIEAEFYLADGTTLSRFQAEGEWLWPRSELSFPLKLATEWSALARAVGDLITTQNLPVKLSGNVFLSRPPFGEASVPFEKDFDLAVLLSDAVRKKGEELLDSAERRVREWLDRFSNGVE